MGTITKVSQITADYLADYLRVDTPTQDQKDEIGTMLHSAKAYVSSFVGLPEGSTGNDADPEADTLDKYPEFVTAVCVLVQNQYDNRTFYTDKGQVEAVVNSILGMQRRTLL
jgi:uncharacterized phage protein (predicted DNA packaging)